MSQPAARLRSKKKRKQKADSNKTLSVNPTIATLAAPTPPPDAPFGDAAYNHDTMGEHLLKQSCFQNAIFNHQQALAIRQANHQPELEADSRLHLRLAMQRALDIQRQVNPSFSKTVKATMHVASVYEKQGLISEALQLYQEALTLEQGLHPDGSSVAGDLYRKIGLLWHCKGETPVGWDSSPTAFGMSSPVQSTIRRDDKSAVDTTNDCESTNGEIACSSQSRAETVEAVTCPKESNQNGVASPPHEEKEQDEDHVSGNEATMPSLDDNDELEQNDESSTDDSSRKVDAGDHQVELGEGQRQESEKSTPAANSLDNHSTSKDVGNEAKEQEEEQCKKVVPGKRSRRKRKRQTSTKSTKERMFPDLLFDDQSGDDKSEKVAASTKNSKADNSLADESDGCESDAQPTQDKQDETMEESQRDEHPPMRPSNLSENKEKDSALTAKQLHPPAWTTDEDEVLLLSRRHNPDLTWAEIAASLPGNRSHSACYNRYHSVLLKKYGSPSKRPRGRPRRIPQPDSETRTVGRSFSDETSWTTKENAILKRNKAKGLSWGQVARLLPERTWRDCKQQYEKLCTTMKDTPTSLPMSDGTPSPKGITASITNKELVKQNDAICKSDEEMTTSCTNPEPATKETALTYHRKNRMRCKDTLRWTENDRRLVQNSYLLTLPRW